MSAAAVPQVLIAEFPRENGWISITKNNFHDIAQRAAGDHLKVCLFIAERTRSAKPPRPEFALIGIEEFETLLNKSRRAVMKILADLDDWKWIARQYPGNKTCRGGFKLIPANIRKRQLPFKHHCAPRGSRSASVTAPEQRAAYSVPVDSNGYGRTVHSPAQLVTPRSYAESCSQGAESCSQDAVVCPIGLACPYTVKDLTALQTETEAEVSKPVESVCLSGKDRPTDPPITANGEQSQSMLGFLVEVIGPKLPHDTPTAWLADQVAETMGPAPWDLLRRKILQRWASVQSFGIALQFARDVRKSWDARAATTTAAPVEQDTEKLIESLKWMATEDPEPEAREHARSELKRRGIDP